jgi:uncharacterized protein (DUF362 family)
MNRRRFLANSIGLGLGLTVPGLRHRALGDTNPLSSGLSKVVTVRDPAVLSGGNIDQDCLMGMLDHAVCNLADVSDPVDAWKKVVAAGNPSRVIKAKVAIKVNSLAGQHMSTHPQVAMAVARRLLDAGVRDGNVLIWDRSDDELKAAGYTTRRAARVLVYGTDYVDYSGLLRMHRSIGSRFSRILTGWATDLINIPVLKDHGIVGVTLGMKNWYGAVHNPFKYHPNCGDPYIADLSHFPLIRDKLRLVVVDALRAQYHGGPPYHPQWAWSENALMLSADPVAIDRVGWDVIEAKRQENGMPTLAEEKREPKYIYTAGNLGLGTADLNLIDHVEILPEDR